MKQEIVAVIVKELQQDDSDMDNPSEVALNCEVRKLELTRHGPDTTYVTNGPGYPDTGGADELWLFNRAGDHVVLIFHTYVSWGFLVAASYHHGMNDLEFPWHLGGGRGSKKVYRFDGKQYHCAYSEETAEDDNDHWKVVSHKSCKGI
jgi:hypothetical protein